MAKKAKYLSYIEDTPKHHNKLGAIARKATNAAKKEAHAKNLSVTYLKGESIIKEKADGSIEQIGQVENNRRKIAVGTKILIKKK